MSRGAPSARVLTSLQVSDFVAHELLAPDRTRPVVALTTWPGDPRFPIDPEALARTLGDRALVVAISTGEDTWALSSALPKRLDVYGGASRIWWPDLTANSDPYAHPLLFAYSPAEAGLVCRRIVAAICEGDARAGRSGRWDPEEVPPTVQAATADRRADASRLPTTKAGPPRARPVAPVPTTPEPVRYAVVTKIAGATVEVSVDGTPGLVTESDVPLERLAADMEPGQHLRVRRIGTAPDGRGMFSVRGLRTDPWRRLPEVYAVNEIVRGAICRIESSYVLVEVLPGAALIVPRAEIDWTDRRHPAQIFKLGERVRVRILTMEPERQKASGSIKQAYMGTLKPPVSPGPGQPPFLGDDDDRRSDPVEPEPPVDRRAEQLAAELDSALTDREELMRQLRVAKEQVAELRRENRSIEDRLAAISVRTAGQMDPTSSESAFLAAVRVEYARRFDEGDRERSPLARMRVGRVFLESLRELDGISVEKVVEVCAQVAAQRAHTVAGREVHPLRSGNAGAPTRVRKRDAAKAWRCSLQDGTASARRLHWWDIPGGEGRGRTIEFASVGVHDEMGIPE